MTNYPSIDVSPHRSQLKQILGLLGFEVTDSFGKKQNSHLFSPFADTLQEVEDIDAYARVHKLSLVKESKARLWGKQIVGVKWLREVWCGGNVGLLSGDQGGSKENQSELHKPTSDVKDHGDETTNDVEDETQAMDIHQEDTLDQDHPAPDNDIGQDQPHEVPQPLSTTNANADPPTTTANTNTATGAALKAKLPSIESQRPLQSQHQASYTGPPETQTLAGQSMWATRMQGEVEALFRDREQTATSPPSVSVNTTTAHPGSTRPKGKLPPKSRRSAAAAADGGPSNARTRTESPVPNTNRTTLGSRSNSISPFKSTDGADQGNIDAAKVLAEHRLQQQQYDTSTSSSRTNSTIHSHGMPDDDENEVEESIRVTYRDPAAEKERKKLQDLVERGEREREREREDRENRSPDNQTVDIKSTSPASTFGTGRSRPPQEQSPKKKVVARRQPGTRQ